MSTLRASDLARRVAMVADVLDEVGATATALSVHCDGQVTVHVEDQLGEVASRLGLQHTYEVRTMDGRVAPYHEGTWADIPVRVFGRAAR